MKKVVLTLCLFTLVAGGVVLGQSRSARSADEDTEARSRSRSRSEKKMTRSEKKALEKAKKQRAQEAKKQKAELDKARKQQEKAMRDQERARSKEKRRLARKANRSLDDEEGFASRKRSKKQEKAVKQVKKQEKKKKVRSLSRSHSHSKLRREEHPKERVVRSARSRSAERSAVKRSEVKRSAKRSEKKRSAIKVDTRKIEREQRKLRERQEKEERKRRAALKHEEKNQERTQRLADLRAKDLRKKDEHRAENERRTELARQLVLKEQKRVGDQAERLAFARQDRAEKMHRWTELHGLDLKRDYDGGRYADLFKAPAWPVASWFFENKDLLNVNVSYKYATDAYADNRSRYDVSGIEFGYKPIQLQDVLLASKLVRNALVAAPIVSPLVRAEAAAYAQLVVAGQLIAGVNVTGGGNIDPGCIVGIHAALLAGKDAAGIAQAARDGFTIGAAPNTQTTVLGVTNALHDLQGGADQRNNAAEAVNFMQKLVAEYKATNYLDGRKAGIAGRDAILGAAPILGVAAAIANINAAAQAITNAADGVAAEDYLHYLGNQLVKLNGKVEEYGTSIDFARYVMGKNVALGVQIPVLYRKNTLTADIATSLEAKNLLRELSELQQAQNAPFSFMAERYGAEPSLLITDFLQAKGIREMGGSATGLGDVVLFANVQTGARTFEKVLGGLKVTFPTGKKTTTAKLWAPELGTGHTQFSAYASMLMDYNRLLNPHVYIEGIYSMAAHQDKRVPARIVKAANNKLTVAGEEFAIDPAQTINTNQDVIAFGDRVKPVNGQTFDTFDTTIKGLGDNVFNVRMLRGLEFKARIGNMIEKFIFRRGFLDLYYDLHAKFKDSAHGLNNQDYNVDILSDRTNMLAHKIGTEFSYQFDPYARWRVGATYTFAGINAPKAFEISSALGYSF